MLFTIKRILVCSDLSKNSELVLRNAELIRERTGADLDILFVSDAGTHHSFLDDEAIRNIGMEARIKLNDQMKKLQINGVLLFEEGEVAEKINDIITNGKDKYDLLMIGHNSSPGILQHLLGSTARRLLSSVNIPTLVIKRDLKFGKMGCLVDNTSPLGWMITSSLDFYRNLKFNLIEFINLWHELPEPFGHGGSSAEFKKHLEEEIQYFEHEKEKVSIRVETAKELQVAGHLQQILKEEKIDLAIMKRNRGKKVKTMLLGSETMRMLELDPVNLLVLPV